MTVTRILGVQANDDLRFSLTGDNVDYHIHVDEDSGQLLLDHFGAPGQSDGVGDRREFPDSGRGDYRLPAIHIRHAEGDTISQFRYQNHQLVNGKPGLTGLPATFGNADQVQTLLVTLRDDYSALEAELSYSIFPRYNAIARSCKISNHGAKEVVIERVASLSLDMVPTHEPWEMTQLQGDWGRECERTRRKIEYGTQGFQSSRGYSSASHNPFLGVAPCSTTDLSGEAYGFSLIYSGSFQVDVEKSTPGMTRILMGLNPLQLSWPLGPGETFQTPECCSIYEPYKGYGGVSRSLHNLYRHHLSRSRFTLLPRPVLANHWEATAFDFDEDRLYGIAESAANLGVSLFVVDDGWFGVKWPREDDHHGLGDWKPNPRRFPKGFDTFISRINRLRPLNRQPMAFGLWVEPEMVNPLSELYKAHPDWVIHAGSHTRSETRNQLNLNLALPEVQEYIIDAVCQILSQSNITYVKWDKNRWMTELPSPAAAHQYMLGFYRVLDTITSRFPEILFEGCSSGGGRFDPGILYYMPQSWTSDNTDAVDRISIQMGCSLAYPPSSLGCHVSACPSIEARSTSIRFRAHVAMMGGSFGLELDPAALAEEEREELRRMIDLAEKVNPYVILGDLYRLALPDESNWPGVQFIHEGRSIVLAMQLRAKPNILPPTIILQGLKEHSLYEVQFEEGERFEASGASLMATGIRVSWVGDCDSRAIWVSALKR